MKLLAVALWLLLLVGAYRLGAEHPSGVRPAPSGVASFESALDERDQLARSFGVSLFLRGLDASLWDLTADSHVERYLAELVSLMFARTSHLKKSS